MSKVELKTVSELLDKKFVVPLYQRGYRWETQQVQDLLKDIDGFMRYQKVREDEAKHEDFHESVSTTIDDFYCLQPLAVKEEVEDEEAFLDHLPQSTDEDVLLKTRKAIDDSVCWEVIDGQQRLTTIFIILHYLDVSKRFQIRFERWKKRGADDEANKNALSNVVSKIADQLNKDHEYQNEESVDSWHVCNAYKEIIKYFGNGQNCGVARSSDEYKAQFLDTLLNKVQFIWYESDEKDPVKVFTRLNIGKIALTNSELIKALFLNRSNFAGADFEKIRLRQTEIAVRWDEIETTLQNDEFWMFIHSPGFDKPTRIDFIFELVSKMGLLDDEQDEDFMAHKDERLGNDQYRAFRYFNEYFHSKKAAEKASKSPATLIEQCWQTIDSVFAAFREWFDDLKFYHYVGFLVACDYKIEAILTSWRKEGGSKELFVSWLKNEITNKITACKNLGQSYGFNVGDPPRTQCRHLLLLHNIQSVINQNAAETMKYDIAIYYKFPFHLYKTEKWNVEHVDSNTENRLDTANDMAEWLKSAWCFLPDGSEVEDVKVQILNWFNQRGNNVDPTSFENLHEEILKIVAKGRKLGDESKNTIENFVLLDEKTNKSYGNAIFPVKKMILMGKMQGVQYQFIEKSDDGVLSGFEVISKQLGSKEDVKWETAFVPPVTQRVFLKAFNPVSSNPWSWDADDAKAYRKNIYETLKEFGVTMPKEDNGHE